MNKLELKIIRYILGYKEAEKKEEELILKDIREA